MFVGSVARHENNCSVTVRVRFYARYAEVMGLDELMMDVPVPATVGGLVGMVREHMRDGARLPERPMVAVNEQHALPDRELVDGDVVAFLPPLAGG